MSQRPIIRDAKLGRKGAVGMYYSSNNGRRRSLIEIDPKQKPRAYMNTVIHETLHHYVPDISECEVRWLSAGLTDALWRTHFRKLAT